MYEWTREAALRNKGAEYDYKMEWEAERYLVGGKMFAMKGEHKDGRPIISMKCDPDEAVLLREQYADIIPGYYMNKQHWNSIYLDGVVPQADVERMLQNAYELILHSLTKKKQAEILEG